MKKPGTILFPDPFDNLGSDLSGTLILDANQYWHIISAREKWSDDWVFLGTTDAPPKPIPLEITWSVSPTLPVATFKAFYGDVLEPGGTQFEVVTPASIMALKGQFVHVNCWTLVGNGSGSRDWFGIFTEAHDEPGGINPETGRAYGTITLVAYGMEKLLADHVLLSSWFEGADGFVYEVDHAIDFNRAGPRGTLGNRKPDPKVGPSYEFGPKESTNVTWSSRDVLEYLVRYQTPRDQASGISIPFRVDLTAGIPASTDAPVIRAQDATTYSIISQILDRRRCLMWWVDVDTETNQCVVKADTMIKGGIVGEKIEIPANSNQINIRYETDPLTNVVINDSDLPVVDQVVVQGPRVRCCGTLKKDDDNVEGAWSSEAQTTYDAGGTPHPANTPLKRKQTRNDAARRSPTLEDVYSLFQIPEDWDQEVGGHPLFLKDNDTDLRPQNTPELFLEQTLPLLIGVDYSGTLIEAGAVATSFGTNEEMRPFIMFLKPWTSSPDDRYQNAEGSVAGVEITHAKENPRLSCHVSIPQNTRTIRVKVQGGPQHSIAFSDFSPISGEDPKVGEFDWQDALFTVSLVAQFRPEGRYPLNANLPNKSAIRRKVIYGGDQYFRDYVAPGTVVGLDEDGFLVKSTTGGYIPAKGSASDPAKPLADIARIAGAWYCERHYILSLESYRLKSAGDIPLGCLVLKAGGDPDVAGQTIEINAPVTQITYNYPLGGDKVRPPIMKIKTWAGELDAVEFVAVKTPALKRGKASGAETARAMRTEP